MRADETLDSIVDEVAQQMTVCVPDAEFTANVMRRVARQPTPHRSWRAAFVLAPMATAAAVAIVMVFGSRTALDKYRTDGIHPPTTADSIGPVRPTANGSPTTELITPAAAVKTAPASSAIRIAAAPIGPPPSPRHLPSPIEPMTVPLLETPPLITDAIPADRIDVDRLEPIPLLAVAPLVTGDDQRRDK